MTENRNLENRNPDHRSRDEVSVLVVSRDSSLLRLLWSLEESSPWHLDTAATGWDAMERLQSEAGPQLLLLEVPRGDSDTLHFLRWVRRLNRNLRVVLFCHADEAAQANEELRKGGAGEIVIRPFDAQQVEFVIRRQFTPAAEAEDYMASIVSKDIEPLGRDTFFVSASLIMQKLRAQAALMAKTDVPVLILGERGSGKFTVASLIHNLSVRSGFRLRRINCAQMPEVLEAELFDAEGPRGSFGKFAAGEKGTLFLDEITALPAALQSKLLQILQNEELKGPASGAVSAPVRIVAASSFNIERALAEKWLREDLYYRLSAFTVHVPPVRQRKDEIPILLRYFMHQLAKHYTLPPRTFTGALLDACQRYSWPGNLKEMETFVKRYLVAGDPEAALREMSLPNAAPYAPDDDGPLPTSRWAVEAADDENMAEAKDKESRPESLKSLIQGIKSEAEKNAIGAALKTTGWNRKAAARLLRVSYRTLLYKIEQYQMRAPEPFLASFPAEELLSYEEVKGNGKAS